MISPPVIEYRIPAFARCNCPVCLRLDREHGPRCDGLFGAVRKGFTSCDFWPSRFSALHSWPEPEDCEPCPVCGNEERHARTGLWTCECPALDRLKAFGRQPDAQAAIRKGCGR